MKNEDFIEKLVESKSAYNGKLLKYKIDEVLLPNGKKAQREVINHPGAAAIIPVLPNKKIVFVRQYRYPVKSILYEIPAGKLDLGEEPMHCAKRELQEETGYKAQIMENIGKIYTTPGFCDEVIHIFLAYGLTDGKKNPDEDEIVETFSFSFSEIKCMIKDGSLCDAKTLAALQIYGALR